ncbi:MAG TPA: barstar family protein [Flexivirga sp.]|uniref:barstar family protein n=1 Tax=Flexivirga sp. TaxID=1962927 RepID=UPI002C378A99|nr:barstar family protein [Flexivirga sp.]HWC23411.1 barstar family protein [Flexivirga sp.]
MTTPADLIEQGASGLHPTDDTDGARAAASEKGWRTVELNTSQGTDKAHFLDVCRKAFDLPDWFGNNWDALADSLTDVNDTPGTLVLWRGAGTLEAPVRETAAEIFAERAGLAQSRGLSAFLVLVAGQANTGRTMNDL